MARRSHYAPSQLDPAPTGGDTVDPEVEVPPEQCPACGRFLKQALVEALTDDPTPCPRCATDLVAAMFDDEPAGADGPPRGDVALRSVRPPDLEPAVVRDAPRDVLAGWDVDDAPLRSRRDRPPFPTDTVVVTSAGLVGGVLGAALDARRSRGAVVGLVAGTVVAGAARRVWRLEP